MKKMLSILLATLIALTATLPVFVQAEPVAEVNYEEVVLCDDDFSGTAEKPIAKTAMVIASSDADEAEAIDRYNGYFNYTTDPDEATAATYGQILNLHYDIPKNTYYTNTTKTETSPVATEECTTAASNNSPKALIGCESESTASISSTAGIGLITISADVKVTGNPNRASGSTNVFEIQLNNKVMYPIQLSTTSAVGCKTNVYRSGASAATAQSTIDIRQWHNYKIEIEPSANIMRIYIDGNLVDSGDAYTAAITSVGKVTMYTPRAYATRTAADQLYEYYADNVKYTYRKSNYKLSAEAFDGTGTTQAGLTDIAYDANSKIVLSFKDAVNPTNDIDMNIDTVINTNIKVTDQRGEDVPYSVGAYNATDKKFTLTFTEGLLPKNTYTITATDLLTKGGGKATTANETTNVATLTFATKKPPLAVTGLADNSDGTYTVSLQNLNSETAYVVAVAYTDFVYNDTVLGNKIASIDIQPVETSTTSVTVSASSEPKIFIISSELNTAGSRVPGFKILDIWNE